MIVLLRFRSFMLISLVVLSLSFIYVGYKGLGDSPEQITLSDETPIEIHEPIRVSVDPWEEVDTEADAIGDALKEQVREADDFFAQFRMERDRGRDGQIEVLREIINNPNSSATLREEAQGKLVSISNNKANEIKGENILKSKGYEEVVVVVEEENVTIILSQEDMNPVDVTRIGDLITRTLNIDLENIVIIPKD